MCGIAGTLGIALEVARPAAERMRAALKHRGPDDEGLETVSGSTGAPPAVLVHTRLSIVDLSPAGHQPKRDEPADPKLRPNVVTYNGEIYNHRALRPELERGGWPCRSSSDTEVLLHAYRVWGVRAVERFEGMFAFCLLDPERGLAWFGRDRVGIKPLYLYRPERGGLLFASEVRALLAAGPELVPPKLHRPALESFLSQGAVMSDRAVVAGVTLLGPGESLLCDFEGKPLRQVRYWSVDFGGENGETTQPADGSPSPLVAPTALGPATSWRSELVAELAVALRSSLSKLLLADVPVGLFLSSGVDSTAVAAIAAEVTSEPLRTIAVGFDVAAWDETEPAGLSARELGTEHERVELSGDGVLASFDDVLAAVDQPTVDGFNTYHISLAARRAGLTVALSGLGGDEIYGGYASFVDVPRALRLRTLTRAFGSRPLGSVADLLTRLAGSPRVERRGRALVKLSETLRRPADLVDLYLLRRELFIATERRALHALPGDSDASTGLEHDDLVALRRSHAAREAVDRVAAFEFSTYMRHMLLRDADVFSMRHGLEIRVPLLEHYAVAEAARAQSRWRRPDPRPKPLLVDAVGSRLPARSWQAKKRGFTFPWRAWLRGPLRVRAEAGLAGDTLVRAGIDARAARGIWASFLQGDPRVSELEVIALLVLSDYVERHRLAA
jgi:asparagine synthase (glutamine-hydrolysing)